jgi:hypothetical protein
MYAAESVNPDLAAFFRLAAATGARRGELCALQWKDVDLENHQMTISRGLVETHTGVVEKDTKTHAERRITLDTGTSSILEAHRTRRDGIARQCDARLASSSYVFSHEVDGLTPWRPNYVTLAFTRLRNELGLKGVRLHDLRHFNATNMLAKRAHLTIHSRVAVRTLRVRIGPVRLLAGLAFVIDGVAVAYVEELRDENFILEGRNPLAEMRVEFVGEDLNDAADHQLFLDRQVTAVRVGDRIEPGDHHLDVMKSAVTGEDPVENRGDRAGAELAWRALPT